MKNIAITMLLGLCLFAQDIFGQVPQGFNYQAVARNLSDEIIKDEFVSVRFSILEDNASGAPVYREVHESVYTGVHGVMTLIIGQGNPETGAFANIDWGSNNYFVRVDLDVNNGSNFDQMGVSQLLTVPYAMFAQKSGDGGSGGNDDWGTQTVQHNNTLIGDGTIGSPLSVDTDRVNTDNQMLSINGNQLSLTNGGTVSIPTGGTDADADPMNEIQSLSNNKTGTDVTVEIDRGGAPTTFSIADGDSDPTGEIQELSISGNMLTLNKGGGTISIPTGGTDADADPMNELQDLVLVGSDTLTLSGSDSIIVLADNDPMNELQNLELAMTGNGDIQIGIENGNSVIFGVKDDDSNPFNELQTLDVTQDPNGFTVSFQGPPPSNPLIFVEAPFHSDKNVVLNNRDLRIDDSGGALKSFVGTDSGGNGLITIVSGGTQRAGMRNNGGVHEVFGDVKNFRMDYPGRSGKEIWYASVEGPEAGAYERGTATLANGEVFVPFTDHFQMVIVEKGMTVMLTPLSGESLGLAVIEKTSAGFKVKELHKGTGDYSFDWEVKGVRTGFEDYQVIRDKSYDMPAFQSKN